MGVKILTEVDMNMLQYESSIVIGNSDKIPAEKCDVLYEAGTNFTDTFNLACETAREKGVRTIKLLQGEYLCETEMVLDNELYDGISIIGRGMPNIINPDSSVFVMAILDISMNIDGVKFGAGNGGSSLSLNSSTGTIKLNNIITEGDIEAGGQNITISNSTIESLTILRGTRYSFISGNIITTLTDLTEDDNIGIIEPNNVINGNIIDGVPQVTGSSIIVDDAMSSTSENPVQNKVVKNYIDIVDTKASDAEDKAKSALTKSQANSLSIESIEKALPDYAKTSDVNLSVTAHNTSRASHNDIRQLVTDLTDRLNALANSDDTTLDQMSEVVAYIKNNKSLIEGITNSKVSVTDIIDNLTSSVSNKPLSAKQGVELKKLIDAIKVPAKLSELSDDATHRLVTDTEKQTWNGKLGQSDLESAVDTALSEAKASGEFDGTSVTVSSVSESTEDGGSNVVTFSDGKTLTIKNGKKGAKGDKGDDYVLTETDKAELVQMVIESLGGNPVFGYVDKNNNVILSGSLADGTYSVKYEMEDGTIDIGNLVLDSNVYYSVTSTLTNCKNSNSTREVVEGSAYSATITANDGYELKTVTVTMGGQNVSVSGGVINIANVTGNIVITAVAEEITVAEPTNFADPTSADWKTGYRLTTNIDQVTALTGGVVTNYITVQHGDVVEVSGINFEDGNNRQAWKFGGDYTAITKASSMVSSASFSNVSYNSNKLTCTIAAPQSSNMQIRFSGLPTGTSEDVIINITRNGVLL